MNKDFWKAALIRAIRTIAQTALSYLGVGMAISDINWLQLASVSVVAGLISILTSIVTGLPESTTQGEVVVNTEASDASGLLGLSIDQDVTKDLLKKFKSKGTITLRVK